MKERNRRSFLKISAPIAAGVATGEFLAPVNIMLDNAVKKTTGVRSGNAGMYQEIEDGCSKADDKPKCFQNYELSTLDKTLAVFLAPPVEEFYFRAMPSSIVSDLERRDDPFFDALIGTGGLGMTKHEALTGAATSLIFGAVHNITIRGIDTKTIPASATLSGFVFWYLQRKLGFAANTLAHAWYNAKAIRKMGRDKQKV